MGSFCTRKLYAFKRISLIEWASSTYVRGHQRLFLANNYYKMKWIFWPKILTENRSVINFDRFFDRILKILIAFFLLQYWVFFIPKTSFFDQQLVTKICLPIGRKEVQSCDRLMADNICHFPLSQIPHHLFYSTPSQAPFEHVPNNP